jgi:CRISPR system Cascade subunit CasD
MQSWGTQSRFTVRDTGREPSKSGVVGLLCAALGVPREDDGTLANLAALLMGVRVDRAGRIDCDYHTAGGGKINGRDYGVIKASGAKGDCLPSTRYFLADADFLVGLEGEADLLRSLHKALGAPRWPIFLGRKSFVPGRPVRIPDGLVEATLEDALRGHLPLPRENYWLVLESSDTGDEVRMDQPLSFRLDARRFGLRHVTTKQIASGEEVP